MIFFHEKQQLFHLQTEETSYVIKVSEFGHLLNLYYGERLEQRSNLSMLDHQYNVMLGSTTAYSNSNVRYCLETQKLEVSTSGKGDYRDSSLHVRFDVDGSTTSDFVYHSYQILDEKPQPSGLPHTHSLEEEQSSLVIRLKDKVHDLYVDLHYSCFSSANIITRRMEVVNECQFGIDVEKAMSLNLDLDQLRQPQALHLTGKWIKEGQLQRDDIHQGQLVLESRRGVSSAQHAPYLAITESSSDELQGHCYGFSLIYSGNYKTTIEKSAYEQVRIAMGVSDFDFCWKLAQGESFTTPEVMMTFSADGLNRMSQNLHAGVNRHLIAKQWQSSPRPVQVNNWEATYFDFNHCKLLSIAKKAKKLGAELFVLDDGWFGKRDDERSSLGDWFDHKSKLSGGTARLAEKIRAQGLDFGIWVEPEMVSPDSELYRAHPEWALTIPDRTASLGRYQLVLDMSNPDVVDYLFEKLSAVFSQTRASYVKWDHNRNLSDVYSQTSSDQHSLYHKYVLGLYELLFRLREAFPNVLFENCSSGGNRFDLGMTYFMPQTWTSDNTDSYARLAIQQGFSYFLPSSTMSAHVSGHPSHQALRHTPIESRFNVASFGNLGYQLDLTKLTPFEEKIAKKQIAFYKQHREILQYGDFYRLDSRYGYAWLMVNREKTQALLGIFQGSQQCNTELERIRIPSLNPNLNYKITSRVQYQNVRQFGDLINEHLPVNIKDRGVLHSVIANHVLHPTTQEEYQLYGDQLEKFGLPLKSQFLGTEMTDEIRHIGDYGSRLYVIEVCQPALSE